MIYFGFMHRTKENAYATALVELISKMALPTVGILTTSKPMLQMSA